MLLKKLLPIGLLFCASSANAAPDANPLPPQSSAPPTPTVDMRPPPTIWNIAPDGSATHLQTGLVCQHVSGDFINISQQLYDRAGFDVSCGYNSRTARITITLYLTRRDPAQLQADFEGAAKSVVIRTPSAKPRADALSMPLGLEWKAAGFVEQDGAVNSDLVMASLYGWEFEFRATYPAVQQAPVTAEIADLVSMTMKTAGTHLAACEAAPASDRVGKKIGDEQQLLTLSISGALQVSANDAENSHWCAETALAVGNTPYVYMRDIAPQSSVVDRMVPITTGLAVTVIRDSAGSEVRKKMAGGSEDVFDGS